MNIPDEDLIFGLHPHLEVYGSECLQFLNRNDEVIGSIPCKDPVKMMHNVRAKLVKVIGEEEWVRRINVAYEIRKEKHEAKTRTK